MAVRKSYLQYWNFSPGRFGHKQSDKRKELLVSWQTFAAVKSNDSRSFLWNVYMVDFSSAILLPLKINNNSFDFSVWWNIRHYYTLCCLFFGKSLCRWSMGDKARHLGRNIPQTSTDRTERKKLSSKKIDRGKTGAKSVWLAFLLPVSFEFRDTVDDCDATAFFLVNLSKLEVYFGIVT